MTPNCINCKKEEAANGYFCGLDCQNKWYRKIRNKLKEIKDAKIEED